MCNKKVIWQIKDGKRGHENQSAGLIRALAKLHDTDCIELPVKSCHATWRQALLAKFPHAEEFPKPDVIIGCGSRTHSTLLAAGRATGAPTILIMAPPRGLAGFFSLCITPEHDERSGKNIIATKGAINLIQASGAQKGGDGLILIGGPSQHHDWDSAQLLEQINTLLLASPEIEWVATTSRRTPPETAQSLIEHTQGRLTLVPCEKTGADWLPVQLSQASCVWVTEDSVSMIYEALSSGAKVGVLPVPRKAKSSRVIRGIDRLLADGQAMPYAPGHCDLMRFSAPAPLSEAGRVAKIISARLSWK